MTNTSPTLRIHGPADLLTRVPYLLGFTPCRLSRPPRAFRNTAGLGPRPFLRCRIQPCDRAP